MPPAMPASTSASSLWPALGLAIGFALVGCADDPTPPPPSILAYTEADTGRIVVYELGVGERAAVTPAGPAGTLAVAPAGHEVAYSVRRSATDNAVFVADTVTGTAREITPGAGATLAELRWEGPDWFIYRAFDGVSPSSQVVAPGTTTARSVSPRWIDYGRETGSPTEPAFVYSECVTGNEQSCPRQLVVEHVDGSDRRVIATADRFAPVAYTPDGARILVHELRDGAVRLVARDVVGDGMVDLGASDPTLEDYYLVPGLSRLSPDGTEVLTLRAGALLAVRVDGSGERTIANAAPIRAGFTAAGDVVYEVFAGDFSSFTMDVHVVHGSADSSLGGPIPDCFPVVVAPAGDRLAWSCGTGTTVYRLPGGDLIWHDAFANTTEPVGFGAADRGLVTVEHLPVIERTQRFTLRYTTDDGVHQELGQAWGGTTPTGVAFPPVYSLAP